MATKMLHGVKVELTPKELAEHQAAQTQAQLQRKEMEAAQAAIDAKKASGKAKLKAGEALNDAELSALFGD